MPNNQNAGWTRNQQRQTGSVVREPSERAKTNSVKILMKTAYRDEVKAGDVYVTDAEKAEQLVKLGRATYIKGGDIKMEEVKNTEAVVETEEVVATESDNTETVQDAAGEAPAETVEENTVA